MNKLRVTNSEYERGWWDCFDKIRKEIEVEWDFETPLRVLFDALEKEFNETCGGGRRGERTKAHTDMGNSLPWYRHRRTEGIQACHSG